jgi:hypothetical protein
MTIIPPTHFAIAYHAITSSESVPYKSMLQVGAFVLIDSSVHLSLVRSVSQSVRLGYQGFLRFVLLSSGVSSSKLQWHAHRDCRHPLISTVCARVSLSTSSVIPHCVKHSHALFTPSCATGP